MLSEKSGCLKILSMSMFDHHRRLNTESFLFCLVRLTRVISFRHGSTGEVAELLLSLNMWWHHGWNSVKTSMGHTSFFLRDSSCCFPKGPPPYYLLPVQVKSSAQVKCNETMEVKSLLKTAASMFLKVLRIKSAPPLPSKTEQNKS